MGEDKDPETSPEVVELALVKFFLNELSTQLIPLKEACEKLHEHPHAIESIPDLIRGIQSMTQAASLVHISSASEIGKALEAYFKELQNGKVKWETKEEKIVNEMLNYLTELAHVPPDQLNAFIQAQAVVLHALMEQFHALNCVKGSLKQETGEQHQHSKASAEPFSDSSVLDLFKIELETQCKILDQGLLELEQKPQDQTLLERLMRAAHSIKGAARVVNLQEIVRLTHAMEDCFVASQSQHQPLSLEHINQLLKGVDFLAHLSRVELKHIPNWVKNQQAFIEAFIQAITPATLLFSASDVAQKVESDHQPLSFSLETIKEEPKQAQQVANQDRVLRMTAQNINRLMALTGESLVESRWLHPFEESLQKFKNHFKEMSLDLDVLRNYLRGEILPEAVQHSLTALHHQINEMRYQLSGRLAELDTFIRRHATLSDRLYQEVINSRMRPFADGVEGFPRMVRDLAQQLGKKVRLEIQGKSTPVDRDILEKLESPLNHLLRNAIDHGIELPEARLAAGKSAEGCICLEARHRGGVLMITVADDGRGIDIEKLRSKIVEKNLASLEMVNRLTHQELLDFLFLPGFTTSANVSEISGRGVGLNIVQNVVQEVGGRVHTTFVPGKGTTFHLQLPLTLSVIRALLVEIGGEVYAFPLARIDQAFLIERSNIFTIENRQFFDYEGQNIALVSAWQILELKEPQFDLTRVPVIVLSDRENSYGIVVDRLMGEKELVVQELDKSLGKIPNISAGALMEDGSPILIVDIEDMVRSIDNLLSGGRLTKVSQIEKRELKNLRKRVLVVDDSLTVREVECRLLQNEGYDVETAVNGIDGWNAIRIGQYDLVITDIDMPRMNGIELIRAIRSDPKHQHLPIMVVSYKEGEGERMQGLEAGANYYLTKSSFHDTSLIEAVHHLIGQSQRELLENQARTTNSLD